MTRIVIEAGSHGVVTTVSEMRKRLAKILSPLRGDQEVFFSFSAHIEKYQAVSPMGQLAIAHAQWEGTDIPRVVYGELAEPDNG